MSSLRFAHCFLIPLISMLATLASAEEPIAVFVLAGQSNMEGKAKVALLEHQIHQPRTKERFAHLHQNGDWIVRDDVFIQFLNRSGKLTVGFGSPNCIGPELDFGFTVGDALDAPVLLIKTAWGGKSLYRDFRPPSAGPPDDRIVDQLLQQARKREPDTTREQIVASFGTNYRMMLEEVRSSLERIDQLMPEHKDRGYRLAGFAWFQGWNDMVNDDYTAAYTDNLAHFIRDVRRDLDAPELPFAIGVLGVGGTTDVEPKKQAFKAAQAAVGSLQAFAGNVRVIQTDQFWDETADAVFKKGWREHLEQWNTVGSDRPFHYLGSPTTFCDIGRALAGALLELDPQRHEQPAQER